MRTRGLDLISMRERAQALGRTFLIENAATGGTRVSVTLPLQVAAPENAEAEDPTHRPDVVPVPMGFDEVVGDANSVGTGLGGHRHRPPRQMLERLSTRSWELHCLDQLQTRAREGSSSARRAADGR